MAVPLMIPVAGGAAKLKALIAFGEPEEPPPPAGLSQAPRKPQSRIIGKRRKLLNA
jgi:hypothetical protein